MHYTSHYASPLGDILLAADYTGLTGLWFAGQKYFAAKLEADAAEQETPVIAAVKRWLDAYFAGRAPEIDFPLHLTGTDFQKRVWDMLRAIPYGETITYGGIAQQLGSSRGCAQAVGGAVGHNPISIIVPCHRVVGKDASLTGYAGGTGKKAYLLDMEKRTRPK